MGDQTRHKPTFRERYNAAADRVLNDTALFKDFETILDEQKSIMVVEGGITEEDAERQVCAVDNLRRAVLSVAG